LRRDLGEVEHHLDQGVRRRYPDRVLARLTDQRLGRVLRRLRQRVRMNEGNRKACGDCDPHALRQTYHGTPHAHARLALHFVPDLVTPLIQRPFTVPAYSVPPAVKVISLPLSLPSVIGVTTLPRRIEPVKVWNVCFSVMVSRPMRQRPSIRAGTIHNSALQ